MTDWRDISTAPKDGKPVLLYWPYWSHSPVVGRWSATWEHWHTDMWTGEDSEGHNPTHWMPLPQPPGEKS